MKALFEPQVHLFTSIKNWIDAESVRQLFAVSKLESMRRVVGFPDLHPGRLTPIGAAFVTEDILYPHLIGQDVGCGMALYQTTLLKKEVQLDRWISAPLDLEQKWEGDLKPWRQSQRLPETEYDASLGTVGGGNHFAELQAVEEILDATAFRKLGLGKQQLVALVHSGSRELGEALVQERWKESSTGGIPVPSLTAQTYLQDHELALRWAKVNRALIAHRLTSALGAESELLWDGCHNSITPVKHENRTWWVHRKGAVAADSKGAWAMIPGSRGALSYLVKTLESGEHRAWSLAHGAGRKWARTEARLRMRERFGPEQLVETPLGGRVICDQRDLLYEEAPEAYKNIETVIDDLVEARLISVVATFRPLFTYKTRKPSSFQS